MRCCIQCTTRMQTINWEFCMEIYDYMNATFHEWNLGQFSKEYANRLREQILKGD